MSIAAALMSMVEGRVAGQLCYGGHIRQFCPHLLGVTNDGRLVLHAYQYGGDSSQGPVTPETGGWRYFYVDEIEGLVSGVVPSVWYPADLQKSEPATYKPPKFIAEILALAP